MHLLPTFLQWPSYIDSWTFPPDSDYVQRGHEIWRHAKKKLQAPTDLDRVDCIGGLKRAINHRLKAIQATYKFDLLPTPRGKKQVLQNLQDYGLIRFAVLKDLLEVRNLIEHQDADPPDVERCAFFVDMVWYFLKSTDQLVETVVNKIIYERGNAAITLFVEPQNAWRVRVEGAVASSLLREKAVNGAFPLKKLKCSEYQDRSGLVDITAEVECVDDRLTLLARGYFSAAGYPFEDHAP